jgi:hypothetical protein
VLGGGDTVYSAFHSISMPTLVTWSVYHCLRLSSLEDKHSCIPCSPPVGRPCFHIVGLGVLRQRTIHVRWSLFDLQASSHGCFYPLVNLSFLNHDPSALLTSFLQNRTFTQPAVEGRANIHWVGIANDNAVVIHIVTCCSSDTMQRRGEQTIAKTPNMLPRFAPVRVRVVQKVLLPM